jgi:outer membrane receptor protein involved in Fe transport
MNSERVSITGLTVAIGFILIAAISGFAQAVTGTLRGIVEDSSGGAVAGAAIIVTNEATGVASIRFVTTGDGYFTIPNLAPGTYSANVSAAGFKTRNLTSITVRLGSDTDLKIILEIGPVSETVVVDSGTAEIARTTSEVSANFNRRRVQDLPSNAVGSGLDTLALNAPGVVSGFGNTTANGTILSVNGNRSRSNNYTIDGTDNNDLMFTGPSFKVTNLETVQEYQVVTSNFSALYGRNLGAIVNIVTKSGTNEFGGSAFTYHRNSSVLDAMNNIERRTVGRSKRDKFISNVFGGTFGGAIVKNKAFFFLGFQGVRQAENTTYRSDNPAISPGEFERLRTRFPGNAAIATIIDQGAFGLSGPGIVRPRPDRSPTSVCISPLAADCPGGLANNPATTFSAAFPECEFPMPFVRNELLIRGDWSISAGANVTARYLGQGSDTKNWLASANGFTGDLSARSRNFSTFYTQQLTSELVNSLQATYQRITVVYGGGCGDQLDGCIPGPSSIGEAFTTIAFGGVLSASGTALQGIGGARSFPQGRRVGVYQLSDKLAWTSGTHAVVAGIELRYLRNKFTFLPDVNGFVRFNSRAALANNMPTSVSLAEGSAELAFPQFDQFYFLQDDWRIRPGLTLNLGVRYEYSGQPINRIARMTHDREADPATAFYRQDLALEYRTAPFIPSDKNNVAPRVGLAWSPDFGRNRPARLMFGENDSTVIRGGIAVAYDVVFYNFVSNTATSAPAVFLDTFTPVSGLPLNAIGSVMRTAYATNLRRNRFDPRLLSQTDVSTDFHSPYSIQYSVALQRRINDRNMLEVRYVGNKGKDLLQTVNGNPLYGNLYNGFSQSMTLGGVSQTVNFPGFRNLLGDVPAPQICRDVAGTADNEAACNGRLLAGRGLIRSKTNTGRSQYGSLQARCDGRLFSDRLIIGASYTGAGRWTMCPRSTRSGKSDGPESVRR